MSSAGVMKSENMRDSKSRGESLVGSSPTLGIFTETENKKLLKLKAYIIGVALGDGNLSNPNGRATRLRITCDTRYPALIEKIASSLKLIFPDNKVAFVKRPKNCIDISCYSNQLESLLGWNALQGPKYKQEVSVPQWIKANLDYSTECLRGLIETDGSVYNDRGYLMINFTTIIPSLANDVFSLINNLGFKAHIYFIKGKVQSAKSKYVIRISKNAKEFKDIVNIQKN